MCSTLNESPCHCYPLITRILAFLENSLFLFATSLTHTEIFHTFSHPAHIHKSVTPTFTAFPPHLLWQIPHFSNAEEITVPATLYFRFSVSFYRFYPPPPPSTDGHKLPRLFELSWGREILKYSRGAVHLRLRRNLTSPDLSRQQSGEHDGIFPSSLCPPPHRRTHSPNVSTTPQERKKEQKKKRKKAVPMLRRCFFLSVAQRILPVTISLLPFLSLSSFGAGQSMQMALFPAWQTTCLCSPHKGLQPQAFR